MISGYAGGDTKNPTYQNLGLHAEVVKIEFDPEIVTFEGLLTVFFSVHDPTTLNQQGPDLGTQYRSIVLAKDKGQKDIAERFIHKLEKEKEFAKPIVTEVAMLEKFYPAEEYHQNYFEKNPQQAYCQVVIAPKLAKIKK